MVYLCNGDESGLAVYLDLHAVERKRQGYLLCGTVGDGHYEGEVLIEVGSRTEVSFADDWLARGELEMFFSRVGRRVIEDALSETADEMLGHLHSRGGCNGLRVRGPAVSPHVVSDRQQNLSLVVSSGEPNWSHVA